MSSSNIRNNFPFLSIHILQTLKITTLECRRKTDPFSLYNVCEMTTDCLMFVKVYIFIGDQKKEEICAESRSVGIYKLNLTYIRAPNNNTEIQTTMDESQRIVTVYPSTK